MIKTKSAINKNKAFFSCIPQATDICADNCICNRTHQIEKNVLSVLRTHFTMLNK